MNQQFVTAMLSWRRVLKFVFLASVAALLPPAALAQSRQPVVMMHGVRSEGSTWNVLAPVLGSENPITTVTPTIPWGPPHVVQATQLYAQSLSGMPDTLLAVAHSNGGLVLRRAIMGHPTLRFRGIATVGSPHLGAPAAENIESGSMGALVDPITQSIVEFGLMWGSSPLLDIEDWALWVAMTESAVAIEQWIGNSVLGFFEFNSNHPVWGGIKPSGTLIQDLNSGSRLAAEVAQIDNRVAIRTRIAVPDRAIFRTNGSEANAEGKEAQLQGFSFALILIAAAVQDRYCDVYSQHFSLSLCNATWYAQQLSYDLAALQYRYCKRLFYQFVPRWDLSLAPCDESDGVVPFIDQTWASASAVLDVPGGIAHTEQTESNDVAIRFKAFVESNGVARCGLGNTVSIGISPNADVSIGLWMPWKYVDVESYDMCPVKRQLPPGVTSVTSSEPTIATAYLSGDSQLLILGHSAGTAQVQVHAGAHSVGFYVHVAPYF
jgi:hypothetical protein